MTQPRCVSCGHTLDHVMSFGDVPLVDELFPDRESALDAERFELTLMRCANCTLVQLKDAPRPERLFKEDYPYYSSVSEAVSGSARAHAGQLIRRYNLNSDSQVIEAASNDGYQLRYFAEYGIPVLGIEPAQGPADVAVRQGIPTKVDFFSATLAEQLVQQQIKTDVFVGKNVLAHVPDPLDFLIGVRQILRDESSVACLEFPYLQPLIQHCQFDTIYHEHRCYFSVTSLNHMARQAGLEIQAIEEITLHGGSLRITLGFTTPDSEMLDRYLQWEQSSGLNTMPTLLAFCGQVQRVASRIKDQISAELKQGHHIAAYAAAAKGVILLQQAGIDYRQIRQVADLNPVKQGLFMPGSGLEIISPEKLFAARPDCCLLLAWNFADEVLRQQAALTNQGCRWIIPTQGR